MHLRSEAVFFDGSAGGEKPRLYAFSKYELERACERARIRVGAIFYFNYDGNYSPSILLSISSA